MSWLPGSSLGRDVSGPWSVGQRAPNGCFSWSPFGLGTSLEFTITIWPFLCHSDQFCSCVFLPVCLLVSVTVSLYLLLLYTRYCFFVSDSVSVYLHMLPHTLLAYCSVGLRVFCMLFIMMLWNIPLSLFLYICSRFCKTNTVPVQLILFLCLFLLLYIFVSVSAYICHKRFCNISTSVYVHLLMHLFHWPSLNMSTNLVSGCIIL